MSSAKILVYHGKYGDEYWLADTPERMRAAMRCLFTQLDEFCYYEGEDGLAEARAGDVNAIIRILGRRQNCEYECWDIEEACVPL